MPPEHAGIARASNEGKWPFGVFIHRRIEFADDVVEHTGERMKTVPRSPQSAGWLTR